VKYCLYVLTILLFGHAVSVVSQTPKPKQSIQETVRKLDLAHAEAVLRGDMAAIDRLWTEDFRVNNPFNEIDNAARIRDRRVTYSSFVRVPEEILVHGDTVIVMGRETVVPKGDSPGAGKTINRRYTNIWMKRNGRWRLIARHASIICSS
jgi:ketosteroid isomerase-like protein